MKYSLAYGSMPTPTRTGYSFSGWYTAKTGGTKIISSTKVTSLVPQTVYAHWTALRRTLSFNGNGGYKVSKKSVKVTYTKKCGTLATAQRKGYTFAGWYTKKTGGARVTSSTVSKWTSNATLYAHWTKVTTPTTSIKSLSGKQKKLYVSVAKASKVKGYQIVLATNSKFTKGTKTYTISGTSKTISKLKKGTKYYVRVRTYKYDSAKGKVYGKWSKVKSVKIK